MIISTVVAVALGLTSAQWTTADEIVSGDYSMSVGRYSQRVDGRGTTFVQGFDRRGTPYKLVMDRHGYVEARVGERIVCFRVRESG